MNRSLASFYAKVLFDQALKAKKETEILDHLNQLVDLMEKNEPLKKALESPVINAKAKEKIIERLFNGQLHAALFFVLKLLTKKNRINFLPEIAEELSIFSNRHNQILDVKVIVPASLTEENKRTLSEKLASSFGKKISIHEQVNSKIIGGIILLFAHNKILDYSLKTMLKHLQESLEKGHEYAIES